MSGTRRLSGWGRYPVAECRVEQVSRAADIAPLMAAPSLIARGLGRSYGDASLNPACTLIGTGLNRLLAFDAAHGLLVAETGVSLDALIAVLLPRGWFVPVTPGTRFVTLGGAIASDVHGKNHHKHGSFCDHVDWIELALPEDRVVRCSRDQHTDLFAATCGGMGLTGVILRACIRMMPVTSARIRQRTVRAADLDAAMEAIEATLDWTYSVAWIDCLASGDALGRSLLFLGEHAAPERNATPFERPRRRAKNVPIDFPAFALNGLSVRAFNAAYYRAHRDAEALVDLEPYFYPLDAIHHWNRIYGRRGFVQYQCVLPLAASRDGMRTLLREIAKAGSGSFLAVLKRMGAQSHGLLSFPMPGYTLALDFPANPSSLSLLDRLDAITRDHGGRVYLAKDARMSPQSFAAGYPNLDAFREVRRRWGLERFASLQSQRLGL